MGLLIKGKWSDEWYDTKSTKGKFIRKDSQFRNFLGSNNFPVEVDRYHLYISHACPWAHRTSIFHALKDLQDIISITVVDAFMGKNGWSFNDNRDDINGKNFLHEIYTMEDRQYTGRVTVPVLWDKKQNKIVNNESSEIIRMFNSDFNHITDNKLDFYPKKLRKDIDEINNFVYHKINNGVYKAGFATVQKVYEEEVINLFEALNIVEDKLSKQRYLVGNTITEADWRLFTTLIRFDSVYVGHFKCNIRRIEDYTCIPNYLRELYQVPKVKNTVNMEHIKNHYYRSQLTINPNQIIPLGPSLDFNKAHNRDKF